MKKNNVTIQQFNNKTSPLVSVVMPVYNAGEFLVEAIESILRQSYQNFELIMVDDASTDNSLTILKYYQRKYPWKIKLFRNKRNLKQALTVNRAIEKAKGGFIARMDADDIAIPTRLEKQVSYLLAHPKTIALGGQCILIDKNDKIIGSKQFPTKFADIYRYIFEFIPMQQPTMMFAKNRLPKDFDFYDHNMSPVEDVEMLFKLFAHGRVENLPYSVLFYRIHSNNSSRMNLKKSFFLTFLQRIRGVLLHGYKPTAKGIVVTLAQAGIILFFPQKVSYIFYGIAKKGLVPSIKDGLFTRGETVRQRALLPFKIPAFLR